MTREPLTLASSSPRRDATPMDAITATSSTTIAASSTKQESGYAGSAGRRTTSRPSDASTAQ